MHCTPVASLGVCKPVLFDNRRRVGRNSWSEHGRITSASDFVEANTFNKTPNKTLAVSTVGLPTLHHGLRSNVFKAPHYGQDFWFLQNPVGFFGS